MLSSWDNFWHSYPQAQLGAFPSAFGCPDAPDGPRPSPPGPHGDLLRHGAMPQKGPTARDLTRRYVFALSLVATLSLIGQAVIQQQVVQQMSDARVVNVAGRQRMLSQRLSKVALEVEAPPGVRERKAAKGAVLCSNPALAHARANNQGLSFAGPSSCGKMSHEGLQVGAEHDGLPGNNSPRGERPLRSRRLPFSGNAASGVEHCRASDSAIGSEPARRDDPPANEGAFDHDGSARAAVSA